MNSTYKHVVLIGIDGVGNYNTRAETPNIDKLLKKGAGTMYCLTSLPSISAECWGAMLLGVEPDVHGLTNEIVERGDEYTDKDHPSIFRLIREAHPDAVIGAISNWNPINTGMIEKGLGVDLDTGDDCEIAPRICEYIKSRKPEFLFVQLDNTDHEGHVHGYGSPEHLAAISREDGYVGDIVKAIEDAGMLDDTLIMVGTDHGGIGHDHGGDTDEEKYVFFVAAGKTVKVGAEPALRVRDYPAIVAHALGVPGSENWQGSLPDGLFADQLNNDNTTERDKTMQRVYDFLKNTGTYYLATVEGDQPRVRPFGTVNIFEGKLYIQTGKVKPVSKQLAANPKAEICAFKDGAWIRVTGELIEDDRTEARKSMLDAYPELRRMYDENDGNTQVLFFKNAVAVIASFTAAPVTIEF